MFCNQVTVRTLWSGSLRSKQEFEQLFEIAGPSRMAPALASATLSFGDSHALLGFISGFLGFFYSMSSMARYTMVVDPSHRLAAVSLELVLYIYCHPGLSCRTAPAQLRTAVIHEAGSSWKSYHILPSVAWDSRKSILILGANGEREGAYFVTKDTGLVGHVQAVLVWYWQSSTYCIVVDLLWSACAGMPRWTELVWFWA